MNQFPIFFLILQTLRPNTFHLILECIWSKVFVTALAFQEFTYIVKYYPFIFTYGACSLFSISYEQKKSLLVFQIYEYLKDVLRSLFIYRMTCLRDVGCWP